MSKQTFRANVVAVYEDEEMATVGVSFGELDANETPIHYLLLQEDDGFADEDEDKSLYVELDDQGNARVDVIERIELRRDSVSVFFSADAGISNTEPDAEQPLTELTVTFDLSQEEYDAMSAGLTRVTKTACPLIEISS